MNVSDGSLSDVEADESQATQLIHAVLERSPESSQGRNRGEVPASNKDSSMESYPSSKNSAATPVHQYHFHGLAMTQTQTQPYDEEDSANSGVLPREGSQKENLRAAPGGKAGKDIKWGMPSPDSRPPSPHGSVVEEKVTMGGRKGIVVNLTKPKTPTATFQSLVKSALPPLTAHTAMGSQPAKTRGRLNLPTQSSFQRNTRSRSPAFSDDSFAQGDSQLSEEKLLVTSKKFTMPLADLAATNDEDDFSTAVGGSRKAGQSNYPSQGGALESGDSSHVILVPATPSQSGSSDNSREETSRSVPPLLPQQDDSFEQVQSTTRMTLDSDSNKGSQHSQGYDGQDEVAEVQDLYSSKRGANHVSPRPEPTPSNGGFQETQAATQMATQGNPEPTTYSIVPQTNTSTRSGPRSLLSTMDPNKRNRYEHLLQQSPVSPLLTTPQQFPAGSWKLTADGAETQPSEITERLKPIALQPTTTPRMVPSQQKDSPRRPIYRRDPPLSTVDTMDIIPDSEPLREQVQSPVVEKRGGFDQGNLKGRGKGQIIKGPSHESEETEDSDILPPKKIMRREEEEEEEEEAGQAGEISNGVGGAAAEEDSDDDDDLPLFARFQKGKGKAPVAPTNGKVAGAVRTYSSKVKDNKKPARSQPTKVMKQPGPPRSKGRKATNNHIPAPADMSHESAIPSSVPEQDHARPVRSRKPSAKAAVSKDKGGPVTRKASRAVSVAGSARSLRSTTNEAAGDPDVEMEGVSDSEEATEPALNEEEEEEGEEEEDEYKEPEVPQQNLKRKRGRPPKSKSLNQTTVTPRTRLMKRLKSAGSTMSRVDATRVFAVWNQSKSWYSGVVHERISGNTYNIKFDDGLESVVTIENMRVNQLRTGDLVCINKKAKDYKVVKVNPRTNTVQVDIGGEVDELQIKDISISTKTINSSWQDRTIDSRILQPVIREIESKPTPSPSRSAASFPSLSLKSSRSQHKFLQKVGLVVSLSGNNTYDKTKDGRSRSDILNAVRESGGVVVDDLFKYLRMDITYFPNRCVIQGSDVHWVGEPKELQRLFLLADDCNLKPKYLMALALGIPCLSTSWLYSCLDAGKELDWRPYLLPQGRPTAFDILPSQQIDLNWGNQLEHLVHIMSNPIAPRILGQKSVLCVGPDMTPKRKDPDKVGEAASYILRIILAMGAERVEAAVDASSASMALSQYDLFIIREKDQYINSYPQDRTVDWNWVKDSLIMSRPLPYSSWAVEDDSQCSQSL